MSHPSRRTYRARRAGRTSRARKWSLALIAAVVLGVASWPVLNYFDVFSDKGDPISFEDGKDTTARPANAGTLMPTGPTADLRVETTLADGTKIAKTTLHGAKSGFTGKVWVWAPKEYKDPKYAKSGFPVLIALPGGEGAQQNYWMGTDLKLQSSIAKWAEEGKSLPFIVVMPALNPDKKFYRDGSDIPGHEKMGTWLTEDVPDLVKANFRTIKSRDGWAFMGSSSGGFAGMKAVLKHPDKFKAAIASGPDIVPDSPLWAGHEQEKQDNNPQVLAKRLAAVGKPDVYLAFQVGTAEPASVMSQVKQFRTQYGKGPVHTMLHEIPGGQHDAHTYVPNMEQGGLIQWISKHMQGPTPAS